MYCLKKSCVGTDRTSTLDADAVQHRSHQFRHLVRGGHAIGDDEADRQWLAVLLADVALQLPAGVVEEIPGAVEIGRAQDAGVVLVAPLADHEDVVLERLRFDAEGTDEHVGDRGAVDGHPERPADVHVLQDLARPVDRDAPEVGTGRPVDGDTGSALHPLQLVHIGGDIEHVDLTVEEGVDLAHRIDDLEDDPIELRPVAPPLRVAHEADGLGRLVEALEPERPGRGERPRPPPVVEDGRIVVRRRRIQRREQGLPIGVGPPERHHDLTVVGAPGDALDLVVAARRGDPVRRVGSRQRLPLRFEVGFR